MECSTRQRENGNYFEAQGGMLSFSAQRDEAAVRQKLKDAFDEVDEDKSGSLEYGELKDMLHKAGFEANDNIMKVCWTKMTQDGGKYATKELVPSCSQNKHEF